MNKKLGILMIIAAALMCGVVAAEGTHGASIDGGIGANDTKTYSAAESVTGVAGNISEVNITVEQQTDYWAGFFGNVTHSLVLAGASANFYDWGVASTSTGAVFFANSSAAIDWGNIAGSTSVQREEEDTALSMDGMTDSVNNTFTDTNSANIVISASLNITAASASTVNTLSNGGSDWETVLLRETGASTKIYAGVIQQDNENYAGVASDYQVMLPVGSSGSRQYWLYAALA